MKTTLMKMMMPYQPIEEANKMGEMRIWMTAKTTIRLIKDEINELMMICGSTCCK
jgi:hypothetical protein